MLDTHLNGLAKLCKNFGMNRGIEGGGPSSVVRNKHHPYLVAMVNIRVACEPPCGRYSKITFANCTKRWPYTQELYRNFFETWRLTDLSSHRKQNVEKWYGECTTLLQSDDL